MRFNKVRNLVADQERKTLHCEASSRDPVTLHDKSKEQPSVSEMYDNTTNALSAAFVCACTARYNTAFASDLCCATTRTEKHTNRVFRFGEFHHCKNVFTPLVRRNT